MSQLTIREDVMLPTTFHLILQFTFQQLSWGWRLMKSTKE